jgi:hypothetical protein
MPWRLPTLLRVSQHLLFIATLYDIADEEFLHLPNVQTVDGLLDLIAGCTLVILGNVLDFRTYCAPNQAEEHTTTKEQQHLWNKFDRNDIPAEERIAMCYARGAALELFGWIRKYCIVKNPASEIIVDWPSKYLVNLLRALLVYKEKAEKRQLGGAPHCTLQKLKAQVQNVVNHDPLVATIWEARTYASSENLRLDLDKGCTVQWSDIIPYGTLRKFSSKVQLMILSYCSNGLL